MPFYSKSSDTLRFLLTAIFIAAVYKISSPILKVPSRRTVEKDKVWILKQIFGDLQEIRKAYVVANILDVFFDLMSGEYVLEALRSKETSSIASPKYLEYSIKFIDMRTISIGRAGAGVP